jgi:hypothetical protein
LARNEEFNMVSIHTAPLRAGLACARLSTLLSALLIVSPVAAAQANPASSTHIANVADPQAAVPPVRYAPAFTYRTAAAPVAAPMPDMAMDGMQMPPPALPPAVPQSTPKSTPQSTPQSTPPSMPQSMRMKEDK